MPVTPSGCLTLAMNALRTLLANSTAWRTWCGAADATAALAKTFLAEVPAAEISDRPWAWIAQGPEYAGTRRGTGNTFEQSGTLLVMFEANVTPGTGDPDAELSFLNSVGAVIADLYELGSTGAYLNIVEVSFAFPPMRTDEQVRKTEGDLFGVGLTVRWGT